VDSLKGVDEPRILEYRNQVKILAGFFKYLCAALFICSLVLIVMSFFSIEKNKDLLFGGGISIGILWFIFYLEYQFLLKPLASSKILLCVDKMIIRRGTKKIEIEYSDIVEIKSIVNKNLGGWFTLILKNKKKHQFTIVLERVEYILEAVIAFNPKLMPDQQYQKLRTQLILSDHGLARMYEMFSKKKRLATFLNLVGIPVVFSTALYFKQSHDFIIQSPADYFFDLSVGFLIFFAIMWGIFSMVMNHVVDKKMMLKLQASKEKKRDIVFEERVFKQFIPAYFFTTAITLLAVYVTDLNTLGTTSIARDAAYLEIKESDTLWYDQRYNCMNCKYAIKKNDVVILESNFIGKVIGYPGDYVSINNKDRNGRFIASTQEQKVPKDQIAFLTSGGKVLKLVNENEIRGKIFKYVPHFKN
jgi:hypothetical protein